MKILKSRNQKRKSQIWLRPQTEDPIAPRNHQGTEERYKNLSEKVNLNQALNAK